jgi:hypothetical protein
MIRSFEDTTMRRSAPGIRIAEGIHPSPIALALILCGAIAASGQAIPGRGGGGPDAGGPFPRLPGAVTKAPDWIGTDAPFDVSRFFAPVPGDRNAAPLYLDALFEFGAEMAVCFPEGPERDRRRQAAADRMRR